MNSRVTEKVGFISGGQRIVGVLHFPDRRELKRERIVITCHGYLSSKDSEKYLQIANRFSSQGIAVLRFDFRGSGESEGCGDFLTNRVVDLKAAVDFSIKRGFKSIGILGSSYGGTTAILTAEEAPQVGALVTWSTPCKLIELFKPMTRETRDRLSHPRAASEGAELTEFMRDLSRYDAIEVVRSISKILVVHCRDDEVVPWTQAKLIFDNALEPKQLKVFEKGDHQLTDPSMRREAIELSLKWFVKYL
jgi:dipeptidyl aminopeptidase/acylaminoacyl peptidase